MKKKSLLQRTSDVISGNADKVINQLKDGLSKIGSLGANGREKLTNYVKEILQILPIIEKAGFRTNSMAVGISIPPSIELRFSKFKEIDEEYVETLYEEYQDKKLLKLILKALLSANAFHDKLSTESFVFSEICLEITIPPRVSIRYLNKEINDLLPIELRFD